MTELRTIIDAKEQVIEHGRVLQYHFMATRRLCAEP
jgi:hypothetical protein